MKQLLDSYYRLLSILLTWLMAVMILAVCLQIVSRYTGLIPRYIWTEEVARFCFVWIIMIGATLSVRDGTHFDVDLMPQPKTIGEQGSCRLIVHLAMAILSAVFAWCGVQFAQFGAAQKSEMSGINMLAMFLSFPIAGITWIVFLIEKMIGDLRMITTRPGTKR